MLFFELFNPIPDDVDRRRALRGLRHRILPLELLQARNRRSIGHPPVTACPAAGFAKRAATSNELIYSVLLDGSSETGLAQVLMCVKLGKQTWLMSHVKYGHHGADGILFPCAQTRPQEAAFVLSLLSPDPGGRPSVDAIVRSELLLALHRSIRTRKQPPPPGSPHAPPGWGREKSSL